MSLPLPCNVPSDLPQPPSAQIKTFSGQLLLAEDDPMLTRFLQRMLRAEGFEVHCAQDGPTALEKLSATTDLLLLDLNLPELDGIEVLRHTRSRFPRVPVLVLTARVRGDGTLLAFSHGADDCLTKPFSYLELVARIRALLRRTSESQDHISRCSDLVLDRKQLRVSRGGRRIELSPREYKLLEYLMRSPGVPVSRAVLLDMVWGASCEPSTNVVDVYMKYLRDKIDTPDGPKLIRTVRGIGYAVSEQ